jgi:putative Mg2+ transporter-C (MgtC) family protein
LVHDLSLFGRVALSALLGFAIGWEREVRGHPGGARTFALVSAGAAALTTIGLDAFPVTAEKLVAGIVTGIGFVGAGLVLHGPRGEVKGLTTAAAVWAVATVGIIAGAARFVLALASAVLYLTILESRSLPSLDRLDPRRWQRRFSEPDEHARD